MLHRTGIRLLTVIGLCISQAACMAPRWDSRLTVASAGRISSLDPAQANGGNHPVAQRLGDPLYALDSNGQLEPRLASSLPRISADGRTVTIPLRQDVLFHDGTRFNAEAMAFSLRRFLSIGTLSYVVGDRIASIEVEDPYTLRLNLNRRSTSLEGLLTSLNLTPISPTAYSEHQDRFLHDRFVGTGPYRLTSFSEHQQRLEPFDRYWGEPPSNDGLDLITLSNSTALYGALRSGEVDVLLSASIDEDQRHALHQLAETGALMGNRPCHRYRLHHPAQQRRAAQGPTPAPRSGPQPQRVEISTRELRPENPTELRSPWLARRRSAQLAKP